jgi:hypothetical protein
MLLKSLYVINKNSKAFQQHNPFTIHLMLVCIILNFLSFIVFLVMFDILTTKALNDKINYYELFNGYMLAQYYQDIIM